MFTADCHYHTAKMKAVETIWELHTLICMNSSLSVSSRNQLRFWPKQHTGIFLDLCMNHDREWRNLDPPGLSNRKSSRSGIISISLCTIIVCIPMAAIHMIVMFWCGTKDIVAAWACACNLPCRTGKCLVYSQNYWGVNSSHSGKFIFVTDQSAAGLHV